MPEVSEVEVVRGQQAASASASASADNHNNQNVNTTNSEPQHQQIVVVTTTNGDDGRVDMEAAAEEATHVEAGVEDPVEGQRTVIVHEEVLKQVRGQNWLGCGWAPRQAVGEGGRGDGEREKHGGRVRRLLQQI